MGATFTLISSSTLASDQVSIDLTSIPQTYTHLMLFAKVKTVDTSGTRDDLRIYFDTNTTATNYVTARSISYDGVNLIVGNDAGQGAGLAMNNNFSGTTGQFGFYKILIPSYTESSRLKIAQVSGGYAAKGAAANSGLEGLSSYRETSSASNIAAITIKRSSAGNLLAGSSVYLYGLNNT